MTRKLALVFGVLLALNLAATALAAAPRLFALPVIGIQTVELNESHLDGLDPEHRTVFSAFVETGSLNSHCLATLSETNIAGMI